MRIFFTFVLQILNDGYNLTKLCSEFRNESPLIYV